MQLTDVAFVSVLRFTGRSEEMCIRFNVTERFWKIHMRYEVLALCFSLMRMFYYQVCCWLYVVCVSLYCSFLRNVSVSHVSYKKLLLYCDVAYVFGFNMELFLKTATLLF